MVVHCSVCADNEYVDIDGLHQTDTKMIIGIAVYLRIIVVSPLIHGLVCALLVINWVFHPLRLRIPTCSFILNYRKLPPAEPEVRLHY